MIPDNALENRLNSVKNGSIIPDPPKGSQTPIINFQKDTRDLKKEAKYLIFHHLSSLIVSLIVSLFYGFGLKSIFSQDWNFIGTLGVGFILNQFVIFLFKFFNKPI